VSSFFLRRLACFISFLQACVVWQNAILAAAGVTLRRIAEG
jgi:hypothetical protein